jgi:hypothetical protein
MNSREQENQRNWPQQVPERRFRGPYSDYGWEPRQSVLPEFRDPSVHLTPEERQELDYRRSQWGQRFGGMAGPYSGMGPRSYVRSDQQIYEDVCERMTRDGELDASDIEVDVKNGEVNLNGEVPDRRAKRLAEDISDSVSGVQDVHNRLQIRQKNRTPDRWVDEVGNSGVYPASEVKQAPRDSEAQGMASWGQGERGAAGYNDHGDSEIHTERTKKSRT